MSNEENRELHPDSPMAGLPAEVLDSKVVIDPAATIRMTALAMAVKYHGETVVKDGTMYQQLKLDGKNLEASSASNVLKTAVTFERYLRGDYAEMANELVGGDFEAWMKDQVDRCSRRVFDEIDAETNGRPIPDTE